MMFRCAESAYIPVRWRLAHRRRWPGICGDNVSARTNGHRGGKTDRMGRKRRLFKVLGPGLIAGASDDDPSGIAT